VPQRSPRRTRVRRASLVVVVMVATVAVSACGAGGAALSTTGAPSASSRPSSTPPPPTATPVAIGIAAVLLGAGAPAIKIGMAGDNLDPNGARFLPKTATVKAGQVVEWDFDPNGSPGHNIVFDNYPDLSNTRGLGEKPNGSPGDGTWQVKFSVPGSYHYVCTFHLPSMQGTITVTG
jgi:plastocyanin